jgi:hypothetical protein
MVAKGSLDLVDFEGVGVAISVRNKIKKIRIVGQHARTVVNVRLGSPSELGHDVESY